MYFGYFQILDGDLVKLKRKPLNIRLESAAKSQRTGEEIDHFCHTQIEVEVQRKSQIFYHHGGPKYESRKGITFLNCKYGY